jgi:hypothetical protein
MDIDYGLYSASAAQAFGVLLFVFVSFFSSRSDSSGWIHLLLRERCLVRYRRARDYQGAMAGWFGGLLVFFWRESSMLESCSRTRFYECLIQAFDAGISC